MTSLTRKLTSLRQTGAIIEVLIEPAHPGPLTVATAVSKAVHVVAMIDTGASVTAIAPSVVHALGLHRVGFVLVSTPATTRPVSVAQFEVAVLFPNGVRVVSNEVVEAPLGGGNVQCLIGRDILSVALLLYDGRASELTLDF